MLLVVFHRKKEGSGCFGPSYLTTASFDIYSMQNSANAVVLVPYPTVATRRPGYLFLI